jgi:hypothetical protein
VADSKPTVVQGVARRLVPLRWARSQKLLGYYDPDAHALVYQDTRGQVVDRVQLPTLTRARLTNEVE